MDSQETPKGLIYGVEARPPLHDTLFAALQHLLAIFVAIITPPLIIAGAMRLDQSTTGFLISMALFASGISTFIQCRRVGPIGAKLLCIQGTSFSFITPIINAGLIGGLPLIFGCCIAAAPVEMALSRSLRYLKMVITPMVAGIVVTLIGLSLIRVGVISCGGGFEAMENGTFASTQNLIMAGSVLGSIIFFSQIPNKYIRMSSVVIGLLVGMAVAFIYGMVDFSSLSNHYGYFNVPVPFKYGLDFNFSIFVSIGLVYLITAIEAYGDITANSVISDQPLEGPVYMKRLTGGIFADGFNSMLAGVFNSFPNSIFAQNNGMIQLTGVASRYVGYYIAGALVLMGIFPIVGVLFTLIPAPVLGGATLLMFGSVAAAGIRIMGSQKITRKAALMIAVSLSVGLSVEMVPDILKNMPDAVRNLFSSGITAGGITAILSNLIIRIKE